MEKNVQNGRIRIFENPVLEALTKTSPLVTLLVYVPLVLILLYLNFQNNASVGISVAFFAGGIFFWTFLEYLLHRFLFHYISESKTAKRIHYVLHGVHHHYPKNKEKLFMPPVPGLSLVAILFLIFSFILGDYIFAFLPGLITGYLCYVFLHYFIHTIKPPKMLKKLWSHHFLHHHKYSEKCFGVSTPFWDKVFGTMPPKNDRQNFVH